MLFVRDLWYVCACVYESSEASAYSFGLATNPNPTRARRYPLNIDPKPDPKPESISGPAGSGRVADLYSWLASSKSVHSCITVTRAGRYGAKMITIIFFISVDINNYHDKCQIFILSSLKPDFCSNVKAVETRPYIFLNTINI